MSSSLVTNSDYLISLNSGANTLSIAGTVAITGNLSVTGNATLSGNILGDRIQNGTTSIDIQTINGNANVTVGGVSNVAVLATTGAYVAGVVSATGNIIGNNLSATNLVINRITSDDSTFVTIEDGLNVTSGFISAPESISLTAGSATWTLGTNDTLTLPGGSKLRPVGANLDLVAGTGAYVNLITSDGNSYVGVDNAGGYIVTAGGTWSFGTTGNLTAPGAISAVGNITGGNLLTAGVVKTGSFVTGTIPTAAGVGAGARAFVTDADSVTFGNLYVGGAANAMPVWSNGTSWYVG